jgi:peptidoglycan/LPS O-acetylase OafA/YrhL
VSNEKAPSVPIIGLDFLRLFAAALVMFFHLAYISWGPIDGSREIPIVPYSSYPSLVPFSWFGAIGVDIFFVISGFVILYSSSGDAFLFFKARILRLVPAAFICASVTAVTLWLFGVIEAKESALLWAKSVFFVPFGPWIDGVYWTLAIEISFYAMVWCFIFFGLRDRFNVLIICIGLASSLYWIYVLAADHFNLPILPVYGRLIQIFLLRDGCCFAIGGLLWQMGCRDLNPKYWFFVIFLGGVVFAKMISTYAGSTPPEMPFAVILIPPILWATSVALLWGSVRANSVLATLISPSLARMCGIATYPLYLIHNAVGIAMMAVLIGAGVAGWAALLGAIIGVVMLSLVIAKYAEPPLRKQLARLIDGTRFAFRRGLVASS